MSPDPNEEFRDLLRSGAQDEEMREAIEQLVKVIAAYYHACQEASIDEATTAMLTAAFQHSLLTNTPQPPSPS